MFSKNIENMVGKGEIAHDEQFLLFPQCFQKTHTADTLKPELVWERVNLVPSNLHFNSLPNNKNLCKS